MKRSGWKKHLKWIVPLLIADVIFFTWLIRRGRQEPEEVAPHTIEEPARSPSPWKTLRFPTAQTALLDPAAVGVFQPTASGNPGSALYGSVRTANNGSGLMPSFHEGIDIAAMERDRRGQPLDTIHAIADGRVAYVNRVAGNSNYGKYVVLLHDDPALGEVYSLYAHLMSVESGLKAGLPVIAGTTLGIMGNTSSSPIPMLRAHLHLEIGLINNSRFASWYRANKFKPDHGTYHGRNFLGVNPLDVFAQQQGNPDFDFRSNLAAIPPAFEVVLRTKRLPDFFHRYPALWIDAAYADGPVVVQASENGVPLSGRNATEDETRRLGRQQAVVLNVREDVLGRNGAHILRRKGSSWQLARSGEMWREVLTY